MERDHHKSSKIYKKRTCRIKLEELPPVNNLQDLINIGNSTKLYKNINTIMLWNICPYLEELNNMIGMKELKESIFDQIIYYMQGMHLRNREGEYLHTVLMGPPGSGKCLAKNTPVLMFDGSIRKVQDIVVGDVLMGDDSEPRNVLSLCNGKEMMYKIIQQYGDDYVVNESHILSLKLTVSPKVRHSIPGGCIVMWYNYDGYHIEKYEYSNGCSGLINNFVRCLPKKGSVIDIPIQEYMERTSSWKAAYQGFKVSVRYKHIDTKFDPYLIGYILGYKLSRNSFDTSVILDKGVILHIQQLLTNNIEYTSIFDYVISIIESRKIPKEYVYNSYDVRKAFISGIIDSGGCIFNNFYEINVNNKIFMNQILNICRSIGIRSTVHTSIIPNTQHVHNNQLYRIVLRYNTHDLPTKILINQYTVYDELTYKIQVKPMKPGNYYGFQIDGNKRFLLGDFTVTHNTTVAQIIGRIYQEMGILSKYGHFRIAHRDDFIAGYLGQTAIKTNKLLTSCLGGVLFIDEVYALGPGGKDRDSFSKEAIDTLTSFLSEHTNDFCCIIAGYEKDIYNCFFAVNAGLESRFQWKHCITNYTSDELASILIRKIHQIKWNVNVEHKVLSNIININKKLFVNAGRDISNLLTKCKIVHAKRVMTLGSEHKFILTLSDIENGIEMVKKYHKTIDTEPPFGMYI